MENQGATEGDVVLFRAVIPCRTSGTHGLTVRVVPHHVDLGQPHETGLITWHRRAAPIHPPPTRSPRIRALSAGVGEITAVQLKEAFSRTGSQVPAWQRH